MLWTLPLVALRGTFQSVKEFVSFVEKIRRLKLNFYNLNVKMSNLFSFLNQLAKNLMY